jgi:dihydrofolate reductase
VWVVGGSMLVKASIQQGLADEIRISILPIILGDGLLFFDHTGTEQTLKLKDTTAYRNGMVELHYQIGAL